MSIHLNFLLEFTLSHQGMIKEIRNELDVIKTAYLSEKLGVPFEVRQRILVMPLRKLLCELGVKNNLLRKVCPEFRMPPIGELMELTRVDSTEPSLHIWNKVSSLTSMDNWVLLEDWLESTIAFFDEAGDEYFVFSEMLFKTLLNQFRKGAGDFSQRFRKDSIVYSTLPETVYMQIKRSENETQEINTILHNIGYYSTTVGRFIKHMSDKRGAHIDIGFAKMFDVINGTEQSPTTIECLSVYLIIAVMKQIPELANYFPEALEVFCLS